MIEITPTIQIAENELQFEFIRASGPGGQNVNKVATAVQLRFNIYNTPSLSEEIKNRLIKLAGSRVTDEGVLIIEAKRYRSQDQNRYDAISRLTEMIRAAVQPPKIRKPTRPSGASRARRLKTKRKKSTMKQLRQVNPEDWE